jgi:excinuclease UvrABC ATPase subunit
MIQVAMHFLPGIYVPCDQCKGQRYNRATLDIRYKGRNTHEVLEMTATEFGRANRSKDCAIRVWRAGEHRRRSEKRRR